MESVEGQTRAAGTNLQEPPLFRSSKDSPCSSRKEIEAMQFEKLGSLLDAIYPANPFYASKLKSCNRNFKDLDEFYERIPFTTKHEIIKDRLAQPPYGTDLTYPLNRYVRCHQTSGTTNEPIRWLDTQKSWDRIVSNWDQILCAGGVTPSDRFLFAFSFGPFLGFWSALDAVIRKGCFYFPAGGMSTAARVRAILDNKITVLCCTPTYAQHLGEMAREKKIELTDSALRLVIVAGECGGSVPAVRARIESLLPGAKVFDHHGMTEVGPVTYQCPAQSGILHVLESAYLPEIVDPRSGKKAAPGDIGELVLTTLERVGSPLLRYRTGDLVKAASKSQCACGTFESALVGGILGRSDDMVIVRGVNIYPALVDEIVRRFTEVLEYRVNLDARDSLAQISVEIEPAPQCTDQAALRSSLQAAFQDVLNLRMPVTVLPSLSLPRFEMKAQRWVRVSE